MAWHEKASEPSETGRSLVVVHAPKPRMRSAPDYGLSFARNRLPTSSEGDVIRAGEAFRQNEIRVQNWIYCLRDDNSYDKVKPGDNCCSETIIGEVISSAMTPITP